MIRLLLIGFGLFSSSVLAVNLELTQGVNKALPIGIEGFGQSAEARALVGVIDGDLHLSGQFKLIPAPRSWRDETSLAIWKDLGVDSVLSGKITPAEDKRYKVDIELVDVAARGVPLLTQSYQVEAGELHALAHHISDEVYQKLTGIRGVFSTRIAYVLVKRKRNHTQYSLEISDMDGRHPQSLFISTDPLMSPAWSPNGREIAYVSFEKKRAQVFIVSVETGERRLVTDFPGINGAPAWSPDGKHLAVVLSKDGTPKLYSVNLVSGHMKQLTFGHAIDTEPRYASDGQSLLFTSGRGGSPQVYRLDLASGDVKRMTFEGNYNARASYTPNLRQMIMLHREDQNFNIGVQALDTGRVTVLTDSEADESPSLAPNGRFVIYATHVRDQGVLAMVSLDGRVQRAFPARDGDIQEPAWSPFFG
jgi:TolB protein